MTQADQCFSLEIKNSLPATITNSDGRTASFTNISYVITRRETGIWLGYLHTEVAALLLSKIKKEIGSVSKKLPAKKLPTTIEGYNAEIEKNAREI